jgi:type II secretory ATPase GspE/PulE/Tfp pilus assembly ATPase PilB-like protein
MKEQEKKVKKSVSKIDLYRKVLVDGGYISKNDFDLALKETDSNQDEILDYLYSNNLITKDIFGQGMAEYYGVGYADLNSHRPSVEQLKKIPEKYAKKYRIVVFFEDKKGLAITSDSPTNKEMQAIVKKSFHPAVIKFNYSLTEDIDDVMMEYRKSLNIKFAKIIKDSERIAPEIIKETIEESLFNKASDVHFEPRKKTVKIRFRVDGVLRNVGEIPKKYYENIINRIKVQTKLKIDDHFSAQDGSMRIDKGDKEIDLRISIVPTLNGEKIVIRVLAEYVKGYDLESLGFSKKDGERFQRASEKPFGMILVTGPTGSGKTTTLYSLLRKLNTSEVNIMTIEDPVEYQIEGVNQIQANSRTNLTFDKGLRSIVRQDPDIILVGEIRDQETAEVAVNAALTGHLLFSTFHANDAATTIPRLLDMGIEPFLLSSTLEIVVAQRLIRRICEKCKTSVSLKRSDIEERHPKISKLILNNEDEVILYKGKGCYDCNHTGYKGRSAIFEMIEVTQELQDLILKNPSTNEIWAVAKKQGSKSLYEDGIEKVKNGITTIEELNRIATPPSGEDFELKTKNKINSVKNEEQTSSTEKTKIEDKPKKPKTKNTSLKSNKKLKVKNLDQN